MTNWGRAQDRREPQAISRRDFGRAAALGFSAALLPLTIGELAAATAETPKKGGLVRLGLAGGSVKDSFDPVGFADSAMIVAGRGLFNGLVEWGADGKPSPELATSWEARDDGAEWVVNLRKGVKFSDGREFTADDAVYSLNLHRTDQARAAGPMKGVADVKKLDRAQIQITLAASDAEFPYALLDPRLRMAPDGFKDWSKPIGTGAFTLDKFDPGTRIALKKSGDYWKDGRGHFDAAEISLIADWSERLDALISGQVDAINRVDRRTVALMAKTPKIEIVRATSAWHPALAMQIDKPPFDNPDVRLALKYSIDRDQILKSVFGGFGVLGNDHPIPPGDPYFYKDLPQRKHDADKAAFYLKRSGVDPAIALQISDSSFIGAVDLASMAQSNAGKAGFKMDVKREPADGFWDNVWLKGPFVESYWTGSPGAAHMLSRAYGADAPLNESHWRNETFEKLLADAKSETDEARRKPFIWEMQAMLHDEGGVIVPVFRDWIDAHRDSIGGHTPHGGFEMDNGYVLEKAYFRA
jgi:peptide/nickel transport system substrate-binding protein